MDCFASLAMMEIVVVIPDGPKDQTRIESGFALTRAPE